MKLPEALLDGATSLDASTFAKLRNSEFRPGDSLDSLKLLRDKAVSERNLRELYRGRAPYELLQNADDCKARRVLFVLTARGLAFAHDGYWFTAANFRGLADGWSDKNPDECIGHKGIGFRSVLDLTPSPHIFRLTTREFFGVKFSWAVNNGHIQEILRRVPSLRSHYEEWTRLGRSACPVMYVPKEANKASLDTAGPTFERLNIGRHGTGWTTLFWLPAADAEIPKGVRDALGCLPVVADSSGRRRMLGFLKDETWSILPFLKNIEHVEVLEEGTSLGSADVHGRSRRTGEGSELDVRIQVGGHENRQTVFQMSWRVPIPDHVRRDEQTPWAVRAMKEAALCLSTRVSDGQPVFDQGARFHVYFPTEEPTGIGLVVHGDLFVKPDRTRLMSGAYNEWLLGVAAKRTANEFLTAVQGRYDHSAAIEILARSSEGWGWGAENFSKDLSLELQKRQQPFVPTSRGLVRAAEVVLPHRPDSEGFWQEHFSTGIREASNGKTDLLLPTADRPRVRDVLKFAGVEPISPHVLLALIETGGRLGRDSDWWYDCYGYLARDPQAGNWKPSTFEGRFLVPDRDGCPIAVQGEHGEVMLCFPPSGGRKHAVPDVLGQSFRLIDDGLANLLLQGDLAVRQWAFSALALSRFEASDLLPRAIRRTAEQLYGSDPDIDQLVELWAFVLEMTAAMRFPASETFWREIGRLPIPIDGRGEGGSYAPAFLSYWPDALISEDASIKGVPGLRRASEVFLRDLAARLEWPWLRCAAVLRDVGISAHPKLLRYERVVGTEEYPVDVRPSVPEQTRFAGSLQRDENLAVLRLLQEEGLFGEAIKQAGCVHESSKVLQSVSAIDGLRAVVSVALEEWKAGLENWRTRLQGLVREVVALNIGGVNGNQVFCRGGGGHNVAAGDYVKTQLQHYRWLPSIGGPSPIGSCFVRRSAKNLVGGPEGRDLTDWLLAFVVVETLEEVAPLRELGVEYLEEPETASVSALSKALWIIGERLSQQPEAAYVLSERSRWRHVHSVIQQSYRVLNQQSEGIRLIPGLKVACRINGEIQFREGPFYYADPGSALEEAFGAVLQLIDADRVYQSLFEKLGVRRLRLGETVSQVFVSEGSSQSLPSLRSEIVDGLGPYLLSVVRAEVESLDEARILRRLEERFEVRTATELKVDFTLEAEGLERSLEFPLLYLRRELTPVSGAVEEFRYVLYVKAASPPKLSQIDADPLGAQLVDVFTEARTEKLAALFPRVAVRYQQVEGDPEEMANFLHRHLGISRELQEVIRDGFHEVMPQRDPPPPTRVIRIPGVAASKEEIATSLEQKGREAQESFARALQGFHTNVQSPSRDRSVRTGPEALGGHRAPTAAQVSRGKLGEREFKRRIRTPGGWSGFTLIEDCTDARCGFDFLCLREGREVRVEIKTFVRGGRVILTNDEVAEAAKRRKDYYLVGLLDEGPEQYWESFQMDDPLPALLAHGSLSVDARWEAPAADLFSII